MGDRGSISDCGHQQTGCGDTRQARWRWVRTGVFVAVVVACGGWATTPVGLVSPTSALRSKPTPTVRDRGDGRADEPQICQGCAPPLSYLGGPVMSTTSAGVTVTPIYWEPGGTYTFLGGLQIHPGRLHHQCGRRQRHPSNVYSVSDEYSQTVNGRRVRQLQDQGRHPDQRHRPVPSRRMHGRHRLYGLPHRRPVAERTERGRRQRAPAHWAGLFLPGVLPARGGDPGCGRDNFGVELLRLSRGVRVEEQPDHLRRYARRGR